VGATDGLRYHFLNMGVVQTMVCQLARVLGCLPELEAEAAAGNRCTGPTRGFTTPLLWRILRRTSG
jgi:hypothetical protein